MLAISIRVRQFIGTQTDPFQIKLKLRSSVLLVALAVVLAALVALVALIALIVLIVSVALIVFITVVAAAVVVVVVAVATLNISRFLTKTMIAKVPAVVAGTFLYKVKHMKQVTVHRIIELVIISI